MTRRNRRKYRITQIAQESEGVWKTVYEERDDGWYPQKDKKRE